MKKIKNEKDKKLKNSKMKKFFKKVFDVENLNNNKKTKKTWLSCLMVTLLQNCEQSDRARKLFSFPSHPENRKETQDPTSTSK